MRRLLLALLLIFFGSYSTPASAGAPASSHSWLEGFTMVVLETDDLPSLHRAMNVIHASGGRVAIVSPPSIIMGWIPFELRSELIGKAGIKDIFYTEVLPGEVEAQDEQTRGMVRFFNAAVRGEIGDRYLRRKKEAAASGIESKILPDALDPPPFDEGAYLDNLAEAGLNISSLRDRGLLVRKSGEAALGNSDFMTGTVSLTVFFVESDGSGTDPDTYTWTEQDMQDYINGVNTGLAWWSSQAYNYSDCWVAFMVRYYPATDRRCSQWVEPILHSSNFQTTWVNNVITNFGYTSGTVWSKVSAFNTWQRSYYGTDWAYSAFVAYNPVGAPVEFTDGYAAAAYRGGPYTYLLFRSFGWAPEEVFTHESGHIFRACDEYYQPGYGGCTSCDVCANGVDNANCAYCGPGGPCMMNANTFNLCAYTPGHLGWFRSPCAPPPLTPPTVSACSPASGYQGTAVTLTVVGQNILYGAFVDLGSGASSESSTYVSPETILVQVSINNTASPGMRDLILYNRDLQSDTLPQAFEVLKSTRHYVSPTGGNVYPYITPADAAVDLADALDVANPGDTVFFASATYNVVSLTLLKGIYLSGGWLDNFTSRDLANGKTRFDLQQNIDINTGGAEAGIDGFIIENGQGDHYLLPYDGYFGGGVNINSSSAVLANCEIRLNVGAGGPGTGYGGGISALNSTVTIRNCYIWGNQAAFGGGIYLYGCSATLEDNTISSNQAIPYTSSSRGGGLYLDNCSAVSITGNVFSGNTGGDRGGAIYVDSSGPITINGGECSRNQATYEGGGISAHQGIISVTGALFLRNNCDYLGGALMATDTSSIAVTECRFIGNTASFAGAISSEGGEAYIDHNLFVGNDGSNLAGACYIWSPTSGSFIGNTLDRNTTAGTAGGVMLIDVSIDVINNIITNSDDVGLSCSGNPLPNLRYNDVWNSAAADYSGCSPGEGSISSDPLFADTSAVDYHLAVHSPAIDAGDTASAYQDPDGSRGDMGWYGSHSFVMDQPSYPKNLSFSIVGGNTSISWDRNPEGDVEYYAVYRDTSGDFKPSVANFVQFVPATDTTFTEPYQPGSHYKISAVDSSGYGSGYSNEVSPMATGVVGGTVSYRLALYQNMPNPFNPTTSIRYELDRHCRVSLTVYDVQGRLVRILVGGLLQGPGVFTAYWNGRNERGEPASTGVYFYRLDAGGRRMTKKMVLLK